MARVAALGCIVCFKFRFCFTPADAHHLLSGGRQISNRHVIPLCVPHHRSGLNTEEVVSRHPWRREFEARYGTEQELLALTREQYEKEYA